jgi:hypothetical protein
MDSPLRIMIRAIRGAQDGFFMGIDFWAKPRQGLNRFFK